MGEADQVERLVQRERSSTPGSLGEGLILQRDRAASVWGEDSSVQSSRWDLVHPVRAAPSALIVPALVRGKAPLSFLLCYRHSSACDFIIRCHGSGCEVTKLESNTLACTNKSWKEWREAGTCLCQLPGARILEKGGRFSPALTLSLLKDVCSPWQLS